MTNNLQTTYHSALRKILITLRESAPCVIVINKDLEICIEQEELSRSEKMRYRKPCLEHRKPTLPASENNFRIEADEDSLYVGRIISYRMNREDSCVCFGEKCQHRMVYTPDNALTPVWLQYSA